jgi:hypothetical protein
MTPLLIRRTAHRPTNSRLVQPFKETVEALLVGHDVRAFRCVATPDALPGALGTDLPWPFGAAAHKHVDHRPS